MKACIRESKGFKVGPMGELVEWDDIVHFNLDVALMLDTADEQFLVIFDDHSWGIHNRIETDELIDDPQHDKFVHQAIPFNAVLRDFIFYEATRPVLNAQFVQPLPEVPAE